VADTKNGGSDEATDEAGLDRRGLLALVGGAVGAFALSGCAPDGTSAPLEVDGLAAALSGAATVVFADTIAELRARAGDVKTVAVLKGARAAGDGGGGLFFWALSSAADDGGTALNRGSGTGAGWRRVFEGRSSGSFPKSVSVRWFGAAGDAVTDDTAALQAALTAGAGGTVVVPAGQYVTTGPLDIAPHTRIVGAGNASSWIVCRHTGDGLRSTSPINVDAEAYVRVENLGLSVDPSVTSVGGGIVNVAGRYFVVQSCNLRGFKHGVIIDSGECVDVLDTVFDSNLTAGVWIVNGNERTPGMGGVLSIRISVQRCRFERGAVGVIDDGGLLHRISECVFHLNSELGVYVAGAEPLVLEGNEFAYSTRCLYSTNSTYAAHNGCGQSNLVIRSNVFTPATGHNACEFLNGSPVLLEANLLSLASSAYGFAGLVNCYQVNAIGNVTGGIGTAYDSLPVNGVASDYGWVTTNGRRRVVGTAAPTTYFWNTGDIVDNQAPTPGGYAGWICVAGGTPGLWKGFGLIEP
jgi:hypothetical protein